MTAGKSVSIALRANLLLTLTGRTLQGRRYLDYDLAAVWEYISAQKGCERVFVAIQDSEAFDSTLLASLINVLRYFVPLSAYLGRHAN